MIKIVVAGKHLLQIVAVHRLSAGKMNTVWQDFAVDKPAEPTQPGDQEAGDKSTCVQREAVLMVDQKLGFVTIFLQFKPKLVT